MAKQLVILDPGMRQRAGHYYEYNMAIANAARAQGYGVHIYASRNWHGASECITPFFASHVGESSGLRRIGHDVLSVLPPFLRKLLFAPAKKIYGLIRKKPQAEHAFAREVRALDLPQDALILCPSASYMDVFSLIEFCAASSALWRFVMRQKPQDETEESALTILRDIELPRNMKLLSDTYDLAHWLTELDVPTALIPIPMVMPNFIYDNPPPNSIFTFAVLGPARKEKGVALLPGLVRAFADDLKDNRVRFFIQTTLVGGQAPEPETEEAIAQLEKLQKVLPNIVLEDGDLSEEEFYRAICDSSCLLVPYNRKRYEARSSGLLVQSFLCARAAIVPAGTWMADQVPQFMHDLIWSDNLEKSCRNAMAQCFDMTEFAKEWRKTHSPEGTFTAIVTASPPS